MQRYSAKQRSHGNLMTEHQRPGTLKAAQLKTVRILYLREYRTRSASAEEQLAESRPIQALFSHVLSDRASGRTSN
jgi:hypothetical protein